MKAALSVLLALASFSALAAPPTKFVCEMDARAVDGPASKMVLEKAPGTNLYAITVDHQMNVMSGGAVAHVQTGTSSVPAFSCRFSSKVTGLFSCTEVKADGFRGEATLASNVVLDEIEGEAIHVKMNTKVLTYDMTFALDACKAE